MKPVLFLLLLALMPCLPSCMVVTPSMVATLGTDADEMEWEGGQGAKFKVKKLNQSTAFGKTADTIKGMFANYLMAEGLKFVAGKYYDFKGSELSTAESVKLEELRNAKSVNDANAALKVLKAEQAAEAAATVIPAA